MRLGFSSGLKKGLYHYRGDGEHRGLRLHLRVEDDGSGVLVVNASRILFLNNTATEYVHLFMNGKTEGEVIKAVKGKFKVSDETARKDYKDVLYIINTFSSTPDVCPVSFLGVEKIDPFKKELSAPYRMDLAITYRCDNRCIHCYAGGPRETNELSTEGWMRVLEKLHSIGIPHVVFTGGEPTLRDDLPQLIRHAEGIGLVTGLVTNGRRLRVPSFVKGLIDAGIDHIQITIESHDEGVHDAITGVEGSWRETVEGIKNAVSTPVYTITNTTLNKKNAGEIKKTIKFLNELGIRTFACNGLIYSGNATGIAKEFGIEEPLLKGLLAEIKEYAMSLGMELLWYTPTQYCAFNPLELELGIKTCSACRISMCIEPNGNVIPCQSYFSPLGNILKDEWKSIWNHDLCVKIRGREYAPEKCNECGQLDVCGGGCPLKEEGSFSCGEKV